MIIMKRNRLKHIWVILMLLLCCLMVAGCTTKNMAANSSSVKTEQSTISDTQERKFSSAGKQDVSEESAHKFNGSQSNNSASQSGVETAEEEGESRTAAGSGSAEVVSPDNTVESSEYSAEISEEVKSDFAESAESSSALTPNYTQPSDADSQSTVSLLIDCNKALEYSKLSSSIRAVLPPDGIIFRGTVEFKEGENIYDLLSRLLREKGIPMEASYTPGLGSTYIEGINSLYELDCGEKSGWVYFVNGVMPNYGCDKYNLQKGDDIRWYYTCDMGHDISF